VILEEGHTFLDGFGDEIPLQQKALIYMYDNSDVFQLVEYETCFIFIVWGFWELGSPSLVYYLFEFKKFIKEYFGHFFILC
jgi:hypothetical protein